MIAGPNGRARLTRLATGHILTAALSAVAELGVVDVMPVGEPRQVDDLAMRVDADADALHRVMRALAAEGLFVEVEPRAFATTELGELLRDGPQSLRYVALLHGRQTMPLFCDIVGTVRTGVPVPVRPEGRTRWDQLADDPEQAALFNRAMRGRAARLREALRAVDWSDVHTVVDVGGGIGGVVLPHLADERHLHGVLFDLPHVEADAKAAIAEAALADRCDFAGGDFFHAVPSGADAYLLSNVLHDWGDEDARRILGATRAAMQPDARLVVLEDLVPPGDDPHPVKILDLQMLVALGGRERSEAEFAALFAASGFELADVAGTGPYALVGRPV